jgi:hypothetical protein
VKPWRRTTGSPVPARYRDDEISAMARNPNVNPFRAVPGRLLGVLGSFFHRRKEK